MKKRAGKILYQRRSENILFWILFFLSSLGRLVYKIPFVFLKIIFLFLKFIFKALTGKFGIAFFFIFTFATSFYFYLKIIKDLPGPDKLIEHQSAASTKIYDRHGQLLYTIFDGARKRTLVKLSDIPDYVVKATIAIEDKDFYKHTGFSVSGIIRAIIRNLASSEIQGGSTITQQLIKNALLTPEKTIKRKLKEIILSIETEMVFSKDEILQMYLNEVAYGGTAYGIEEAAQTYFAKSIKDVNLAEAALLAGLPAAPTKYSPFGPNPQLVISRQHQVLNQMVEENYITQEGADEAKKEKIILAPQQTNIEAPHFVMYVKDLLVEKYGSRVVEQGGLQVTTSLDLNIQQVVQEKITQEVNKLASLRVGNGAALVTNPQTGEILAMVGSKDYFNLKQDGNVNVTTRPRQPGSAIKIVTYALALSNNFTPATVIPDSPITYYTPGSEAYSPINYDNRFHGNVSLRIALASSYNVPAVKVLASLGVEKMTDLGRKMGITTWPEEQYYGLSTTLGSAEVKMTDMAVAYGTIANLGLKVDLHPILEVKNSQGKILDKLPVHRSPALSVGRLGAGGEIAKERVLSPAVAYLLTDILKDNQARTPAFGPNSLLKITDHEVAVKTGTTNDKRDNWTIGYTQDYLVAVWVGNNDNTPMSAVASGITGASPIWHNIMTELLKDKPSHQFSQPENLIKVSICSWNGLLPCAGCPDREEYFLPGTEPKYHCSSEQIEKIKEEMEKNPAERDRPLDETKEDKILEGISTRE